MSACQEEGSAPVEEVGRVFSCSAVGRLEVGDTADWKSALRGGARCWSSGRRIRTEREEEPESIQTSRVSMDLEAGSGPDQSAGLTRDQSSAADFSNQMLEPCFSTRSAVL